MPLLKSVVLNGFHSFQLFPRSLPCARSSRSLDLSKFRGQLYPSYIKRGIHSQPHGTKHVNVHPSTPTFKRPLYSTWSKWAFGSVMSLIFPFWKKRWEKLQKIEGEVEKVAEVVETAATLVEEVAAVTENVSSKMADKLPEDGKLKSAVEFAESLSKEAAHDAEQTLHFIHKVEELKQEMETIVEPVINPGKLVEDGQGE